MCLPGEEGDAGEAPPVAGALRGEVLLAVVPVAAGLLPAVPLAGEVLLAVVPVGAGLLLEVVPLAGLLLPVDPAAAGLLSGVVPLPGDGLPAVDPATAGLLLAVVEPLAGELEVAVAPVAVPEDELGDVAVPGVEDAAYLAAAAEAATAAAAASDEGDPAKCHCKE